MISQNNDKLNWLPQLLMIFHCVDFRLLPQLNLCTCQNLHAHVHVYMQYKRTSCVTQSPSKFIAVDVKLIHSSRLSTHRCTTKLQLQFYAITIMTNFQINCATQHIMENQPGCEYTKINHYIHVFKTGNPPKSSHSMYIKTGAFSISALCFKLILSEAVQLRD